MNGKSMTHVVVGALGLLLAAGCAPSSYTVKAPTPSGMKLESTATLSPQRLALNDLRPTEQRVFHSGILTAVISYNKAPLDPPAFLATHLQAELKSRGMPVDVVPGAGGPPSIDLRAFRMQNHRVSAYSPFVTLTYLSVDLHNGPETQRFGVFIKRGKVPVWSFTEVIEPTMNEPLSLAVKELATKIASALGGQGSADAVVDQLVGKLATRTESSFLDVYALGFSRNPKAVDTLVKLAADPDEYVRLAAISALGTVGAESQFGLLKSICENPASLWQDRAMALKSIGDIGTPDAKAYLQEQWKRQGSAPAGNEATWTSQIIGLYL